MTAARRRCWCPRSGKWRGWSSLCPIHGCPARDYTEKELKAMTRVR